jgi:hypothetical protein
VRRVTADAPLLEADCGREVPNKTPRGKRTPAPRRGGRSRTRSRAPPRSSMTRHRLRQVGDVYTSAPL